MTIATTATRRWTVGNVTITSVVEDQTDHIPPQFFFPEATTADVLAHPWALEDYADAEGNIGLRVQAFVVDEPGRRTLVDPCVGNGKTRQQPFWHRQSWPFMERFADAGFDPASVDQVVHTHLHVDHLGWDTQFVDGAWAPTFTAARHLYTARELDNVRDGDVPEQPLYADSVAPILAAGLADVVAEDADLGGALRLEPTAGHSPGHVSLWVESDGQTALITGDTIHHPLQCSVPGWQFVGDEDPDAARATRARLLAHAAQTGALVFGTHFPSRPAGRVVPAGDVYRFEPVG